MATTTPGESMLELASQLVGSLFESIDVTPTRPISQFPSERASNYLYVLYAPSGMPMYAGVVTQPIGRAGVDPQVTSLASSGVVASYRMVEVGSEAMAIQLERLVRELFGAALPLSTRATAGAAASTGRGRGGARKGGRGAGRPRKNAAPAGEAPRRGPGRPRKNAAPEGEAPRRGPGRPRKSESANAATPAKRGPGRPRKNAAPADATPAKRGPGRPRKSESVNAATPAKRGPGRPPGSKSKGGAKKRGRRAGASKGGARRGRTPRTVTAATE